MALLGAAIQRGVVASRPASGDASKAGQLYFATDEGILYHDNGTAWLEVATDSSALDAHLADTDDAHDASAISFSPTGSVAATDAQAAIAEVATDAAGLVTTHAALTAAHGATGAVVGTTNSQTLTNKTLTAPVINSPTGIVKGDVGLGNVDNTSDATKNAASVTLTNKTLTAPLQSSYEDFPEIAAPSTPASGRVRLYAKSDGLLYSKDDAGTETAVTGGGGGGGTITVEEVDGSPTDSAVTKIVFPNGTLGIASHVATYTPSGGGGGDSTLTAATASRSAPSNAGDIFYPSDGGTIQRDTGAAWVPWGPLFPFTEPIDGDFSWVNQNSATKDTTKGGVYIEATAINGGKRLRVKSAPATPWQVVAQIIPTPIGANYQAYGLGFRQSSDGKLHLMTFQYNSAGAPPGIALGSYKFSSPTAFDSAYTLGAGGTAYAAEHPPAFLAIADNGTNRRIGISNDGQHILWLHDVARTNYLTADQLCFFVDDGNAGVLMGAWLLSWAES